MCVLIHGCVVKGRFTLWPSKSRGRAIEWSNFVESIATPGSQRPRPSPPYGFFSGPGLLTPGPPPTLGRSSLPKVARFSSTGPALLDR